MIDTFQNPLTIAVCEIDTARLIAETWHINGLYQHREKTRKRQPMRIQVQAEILVGKPAPGALLITVGKIAPAGSRYQVYIRADYAEVLTSGGDFSPNALDGAISHLTNQLVSIKHRMEILAEYQQLEAARRRLEAAVCKLSA